MEKTFLYKNNDQEFIEGEKSSSNPSIKNIQKDQLAKHFYASNTDNILLYVSNIKFSVDTIRQ